MPMTRIQFHREFGPRPLFGMVHLLPLPGAPLYGGSMAAVVKAALRDAMAIAKGGAAGLVIENFGDRPFRATRADLETVAAMAVVIAQVAEVAEIPFGVNVLRNDAEAALAIAAATGARFIRVNVLVGAMVTDQGVIEGAAGAVLRKRAALAPGVAIFADHMVKHAVPLGPVDPLQSAEDLRLRGLADAVIVTGRSTGSMVDGGRLEALRAAVDAPLLIGSGLSIDNARELGPLADGAIVGTAIKEGGAVDAPVDPKRVAALVKALARA